jgi:hypothetical protein
MADTPVVFTVPTSKLTSNDMITIEWQHFFERLGDSLNAMREFGPKGNRPTSNIWIRRSYMDITLGKTIYAASFVNGKTTWVDSDGNVV